MCFVGQTENDTYVCCPGLKMRSATQENSATSMSIKSHIGSENMAPPGLKSSESSGPLARRLKNLLYFVMVSLKIWISSVWSCSSEGIKPVCYNQHHTGVSDELTHQMVPVLSRGRVLRLYQARLGDVS